MTGHHSNPHYLARPANEMAQTETTTLQSNAVPAFLNLSSNPEIFRVCRQVNDEKGCGGVKQYNRPLLLHANAGGSSMSHPLAH